MKSTILVTGGAGYIGSHTTFLLAQKGYNIVAIDSFHHDQPNTIPWATVIKDDFATEQLLNTLFTQHTIEAVMHFAAFMDVGQSVKMPSLYYHNNVAKTVTLLDSMRTHGVNKFIFSSTAAVYGMPTAIPIPEDHQKNPINPYGNSKLAVELILKDFEAAYGLQFVALRYFNAAGALSEHKLAEYHKPETHLLPRILEAVHNNMPVYIFGADYDTPDGTCIRDYLHVADIADAHVKALHHLEQNKPSDYFNLGTGTGTSVMQLIDITEAVVGTTIERKIVAKRAGDPAVLVASPTKASTILQWKPQYSQPEVLVKSALMAHTGPAYQDYTCKQHKAAPFDRGFAQALNSTLSEWGSANDEEDFDDLQNI